MKKKVLLLSLAMMLLLTGIVSAAASWGMFEGYKIIRITVDGKTVKGDTPAINFKGRTMVPIYMLKDAGIKYQWDDETSTVAVTSQTGFNPTKATEKIVKLGGFGVTIMPENNKTTATTYFETKISYDADWNALFEIFMELIEFQAEKSKIIYVKGETTIGTVEIQTKHLLDFKNGVINDDKLVKLWEVYGFQNNNTSSNGSSSGTNTNTNVVTEYPELYSNDLKTYLGKLTTNTYDTDSIFNSFGTYGSKYSTNSIWNEFGSYGGNYSNTSAFNKFATKPPAVTLGGAVMGYLTLNTTIKNAISPIGLEDWLESIGY